MGEYQHSIDEKGRMIIPAKFREALGDSFVITRGLDQYLFVYPQSEWSILEQKLKATTNPIGKVKTLIEMADIQLRGAAHKAMDNHFTEADQYLSRYQDLIRQTQEVLKGSGRNAQKKTGGFMDFELALKRQLRALEDLRSVYPYEQSQKLKGTVEEAKAAQENMLAQIFGEGNFGNRKQEK